MNLESTKVFEGKGEDRWRGDGGGRSLSLFAFVVLLFSSNSLPL
jgi:hypothetical protein